MDDDYEKELAGYIADMLPLQYETFLENKQIVMAMQNIFFTQNVPNPTPQQIADHEECCKKSALQVAKFGANLSKKTVEINKQNLAKDELIRQLIDELVIKEMMLEELIHENWRLLYQILPDAQEKLREALNINFQKGGANDPRYLGRDLIVKGHLEQHIALLGQIIEEAKGRVKTLNLVTNGHKKRDDYQDKRDFMAIVRDIHTHHTTIQGIIDAPKLAPYKNKYTGRNTLRGWVKEAIPDRTFGGKRKK
ncbi:conserved hypothetical protein [mine drainage metagenome]|uniref:Uncharacterized protein n=1 Tax=mine drainage metagenome TaxID=410659 RepID=A0A3P3ZMI2_9ZZZZ